MSSTAVQPPPPPISFARQTPSSSPPFPAPHSPAESLPSQTQSAVSLQPPRPPQQQDMDSPRHDPLTNGVDQTDSVAIEAAAAAADGDTMDTTSDDVQDGEAAITTSLTPPPEVPSGLTDAEHSSNTTQSTDNPQQEPPALPADSQPPPPPPPVDPAQTDGDSSDEDGWHPIPEDTSAPDEEELEEIEASIEHSAHEYAYWEDKTFTPLEDPEYTPGVKGRIEWLIENYNGTKENPNRELVMRSEPVEIAGHKWQIKFYPKGNDSEHLSVYVECLTVREEKGKDGEAESIPSETTEMQHAVLPLLGSKSIPKRKSVAAQVSVVVYNPTEPRVNYSKTCLHRFCTSSPDWGWTRLVPLCDVSHRLRGDRQALLRGDKLGITGFIRIVNDQTDCLWEHSSSDNVWDSFAMTGLQSLAHPGYGPDGSMVSAVISWLMFKPFRQLLYAFKGPDSEKAPFSRPKPLIRAFQKVLYLLRTQVQPGAGPVNLGPICDALKWHGVAESLAKFDVMQVWECLRTKLEDELQNTSASDALDDLLGPKRDHSKSVSDHRAPVVGVGNMQEAINQAPKLTGSGGSTPQLLTIELDRQVFDAASRSYVKVLNKVTLDDHITVQDTPYSLYGFITHGQTLESCMYQPIIRPEGPGSRWYQYTDLHHGSKVTCLTQRKAVTTHEGKETTAGSITGVEDIAYIALYVRDDVAASAFNSESESENWDVPDWLSRELEQKKQVPSVPFPSEESEAPPTVEEDKDDVNIAGVEEREFEVLDSQAFLQHEGPGLFDAYDQKWRSNNSTLIASLILDTTDTCQSIREKIATVFKHVKNIQDVRQIKYWFIDTYQHSFTHPRLVSTGSFEYSSGIYNHSAEDVEDWKLERASEDWACRRIWVHIIPFSDLPEPPKEPDRTPVPAKQSSPTPAHILEQDPSHDMSVPADAASAAVADEQPVQHSEDSPMSEPDEPETEQLQPSAQSAEVGLTVSLLNAEPEITDTPMAESDVPTLDDPLIVDVSVPNTAGDDTEMGGTQEDGTLPPPPPPADLSVPPAADVQEDPQTPRSTDVLEPQTPDPPPDEIYFFVKHFDAEKQVLEPKGFFIAHRSARLEHTVQKLLELPDTRYDWWEEEEFVAVSSLRRNKSFASNDLDNAAVIIYTVPLNDEQKKSLADRAAFANLSQYLRLCANARNFPSRMDGLFEFNYFSSQYYRGEYVNGHRHGHGKRIYHSGATYEGSFRLGQRHGHGMYTFPNGDTYDGEWVDSQQHGTGTFVEAASGNTYTGGWRNNKKFGEGVTQWKSAQETERLCRICWEEEAEAAFYDCGHVVACVTCARQVENCPVCRKRVLSAMKLYYVA